MFDPKALKAFMILRDISVKELAAKESWSPTTAYRKTSGTVPFTVPEIEICKEVLDLSPAQVMAIFFKENIS